MSFANNTDSCSRCALGPELRSVAIEVSHRRQADSGSGADVSRKKYQDGADNTLWNRVSSAQTIACRRSSVVSHATLICSTARWYDRRQIQITNYKRVEV